MRKDFKNLDIYAAFQPANGAEWQKANGIEANWKTPEHICVKPVYTKEDLEGMEHLDYAAGIPPYLRGPYSVMYNTGCFQFVHTGRSTGNYKHCTAIHRFKCRNSVFGIFIVAGAKYHDVSLGCHCCLHTFFYGFKT